MTEVSGYLLKFFWICTCQGYFIYQCVIGRWKLVARHLPTQWNEKWPLFFFFFLLINILYIIFYLFRHVQTRIIMAAMDPKPVKLQENVILTFKNLKVTTKAKLYLRVQFRSVSVEISFGLVDASFKRD